MRVKIEQPPIIPKIEKPIAEESVRVAGSSDLDPLDWEEFRSKAHQMLDDILNYTRDIRQRPVWQPIPRNVRNRFRSTFPISPTPLSAVHDEFMNQVLPYAAGNVHPGFMGWVQGGGTPVGMLAEMLAAGLNANVGGRDQIPVEVERQVTKWVRELFGFPETASGLFVTGTSMANFLAVTIARNAQLGLDVRTTGVAAKAGRLTAYGSTALHGCICKAMDLCGLGSGALRLTLPDRFGRTDIDSLAEQMQKDRDNGFTPFLLIGTAGTVDTGAIDNLVGLADFAHREKLWFHVDGAYGALAKLAPDLAHKLAGIERADSLAFDFHKWGQVPYDAGFLLVRNGQLHRDCFASFSSYLRRETRGLAAGRDWPCDYGPDLSRGFRALKTWFTLKVFGAQAIGEIISQTCALARNLEEQIKRLPELELLAPVELNIVCFRYRSDDSDRVNSKIVVDLQESGIVAPSTTTVEGRIAIRAAIVNHRTRQEDIDNLVRRTLELGRLESGNGAGMRGGAACIVAPALPPRRKWDADLQEVEKLLASNPDSVELRFRRASLLGELGRLADSRSEYVKVLQREPSHKAAWNNLGGVLIATGQREAAKIAYQAAVTHHPGDTICRMNFGNFLLEESEFMATFEKYPEALQLKREARAQFEEALRIDPGYEKAHEGLSYLLGDLGEEDSAAYHRREAFRKRHVIPLTYRGAKKPVTILQLVSALGGNVRLQPFLDDRIFHTILVVPEFFDPRTSLPPHQLVVNGIGDAEVAPIALHACEVVLAKTNAPVLNSPTAVLATSRSSNATRFSGLPGVVTPVTVTLQREQLLGPDSEIILASFGIGLPFLLRAPGFHTGRYFLRIESIDDLPSAVAGIPGQELIAMQYMDARGQDGKSRKYRAMMIGGKIYPLHVAISSSWKIHYFTAEMAENPEHRGEDSAFLENMPDAIGPKAMKALEKIQSVLGLDYAGIDFGLNSAGEVLVFEANATMLVAAPGADERWNYRRPMYKTIREAVQQMLIERAGPYVLP